MCGLTCLADTGFFRMGKSRRRAALPDCEQSIGQLQQLEFRCSSRLQGIRWYQLPFGRGKQFLNNNRVLDAAVGGWTLAGTVLLSTGNPFTVYGIKTHTHWRVQRFQTLVPE